MIQRDKALLKFYKSGSQENRKDYNVLRNKTQRLINKRKMIVKMKLKKVKVVQRNYGKSLKVLVFLQDQRVYSQM